MFCTIFFYLIINLNFLSLLQSTKLLIGTHKSVVRPKFSNTKVSLPAQQQMANKIGHRDYRLITDIESFTFSFGVLRQIGFQYYPYYPQTQENPAYPYFPQRYNFFHQTILINTVEGIHPYCDVAPFILVLAIDVACVDC